MDAATAAAAAAKDDAKDDEKKVDDSVPVGASQDEMMEDAISPTKSNKVAADAANDDAKSLPYDPTRLVPQLAHHGITESDLLTATRVLEAVASLNPRAKKRTKRRRGRGGGKGGGGANNNNNSKEENKEQNDKDDTNDSSPPEEEDGLKQYQRPNLRPLRKSLALAYDLHTQTLYEGKTKNQHYADQNSQRTLKRQKMCESVQQKKYIANTQLRRGRVAKLEKLKGEAKDEEVGKIMSAMMVPDGHVDTEEVGVGGGKMMMLEDGKSDDEDGKEASEGAKAASSVEDGTEAGPNDDGTDNIQLPKLRSCYACKVRYRTLHPFYDQLCPPCATLNYTKRHQTASLHGRVAVVTGSRVKIGYQTVLKLLRAGATVVATTRFPNCAVEAYRGEKDFGEWGDRVHVYGLDLRDVTGLEAFTRFLKVRYGDGGNGGNGGNGGGIDILINNACQTVRRPGGYYAPMVEKERTLWNEADDVHRKMLDGCVEFERVRRRLVLDHSRGGGGGGGDGNELENGGDGSAGQKDIPLLQMGMGSGGGDDSAEMDARAAAAAGDGDAKPAAAETAAAGTTIATASSSSSTAAVAAVAPKDTKVPFEATGVSHSAAMSQMAILPEDVGVSASILPPGASDINGQQLDLRHTNSWLLKMDEVSTPEIMECMFINAIAPFVLNSRLKPLMTTPAGRDRPDRYIVNVSAMEGKFYRYKMPNHPHTNMAKAALNMMTRTSAEDLAKQSRIYMNSVDTGWINDENPLEKASRIAKANSFQTPIDEIDAAARILDPIFTGVKSDHEEEKKSAGGGGGGGGGGGVEGKGKEYGKFFKDYKETEW